MIRVTLFSLTMFFFSCQHYSDLQTAGSEQYYPPQDALALSEERELEPPRTAEPPAPPYDLAPGSKIIRTGYLQIEVKKLSNSKSSIDSLLKIHEAYYENENYSSSGYKDMVSLVVRVPAKQFHSFILALENGEGTLIHKKITTQDVTEDYVDTKLRLDNKLAYLQQYKNIMSQASTIKDMLAIQNEVRVLEEEIESKKSRIANYDNRVNYSVLSIDLQELIVPVQAGPPNLIARISIAFISGFELIINFVIAMLYLWPFFILLIVFILMRKRLWRMVA